MQKNKIIEQKAKLLDDGFIYFDNKGHQVKITFEKDEKSQMLEKSDKRVFIEKFNKKDDIELLVIGNKVKENIIINKQRESYKYVYNLELTNLLLEEKNGKFYFLDKLSKEHVFKLSEFIMFDEDNKESKNIKVKAKQINENRYELTVRPNKEWINSGIRKLPVVVDPSVETVATQFIEFSSSTFSSLIETDSKARVGIKGKQAHALNMKINYGLITNELNIKNLNDTKYEVFLELHYDSSKSKSGSSYKTYHSSMVFNYVVDDKNTFRINLTKLVGVGLTELTLPFVHTNASNAATLDDDYIDIYTTEAHGEELRPRLVFEYKEIDSAPIHTKEFSSPTAGTTFLDLQNGSFIHKVNVGSIKHNALSMGLDLVLNSNLLFDKSLDNTNKHLAKGWKTNFHQYIKKLNGTDYITESNNVVYMDGDGFIHRLTDRWYYLIDNVKHYVKKDDVYLDVEQNLKTLCSDGVERTVLNEYMSDEGLIYIPNRGNYNFDFKNTSTKQQRYYIMLGDKKIYVYLDKNNNLHMPLFVTTSAANKDGDELFYSQIAYENNAFRPNITTRLANIYDYCLCDLPKIEEESFEVRIKYGDNNFRNELVFVEETEIKNEICVSDNEDINNVINQISNIQQYINNTNNSIENYRRIIESTYESFNYQVENCEVNDTYLPVTQKHITFSSNNQYIEQLYDAIDQLNNYNNLLRRYEANYQKLLKIEYESVNDLLLDKNNNLLGFDGEGRLILVQDGYGNSINVIYGKNEDKDKILRIESETEKLLFEYDSKDSLSKIIDQYGRIVKLVDSSYNGYDTLYLTLRGEEVQFINALSSFYINEPFGKVLELGIINKKAIRVEEFYTGEVDERNEFFPCTKNKGIVYSYSFNNSITTETITKIHNTYYNKVNTYKFDGAGRLIKGISHKNDHIINEFDGKHLIGEYSFNEDTDVFIDLKEEGLVAEKTILASDNPTGLFAYVIEHNDTTSTMKNVKFNFSLYKVDENGSYTFIKTIQKTMYTYDDTIILPFRVPKGCKVYLNPYNSTTIPSDNITKALLVKLNGTQYVYDKEDHLVKSITGVTDTIYEDFYHDNPTKVTTTDLQHNEVMVSKFNYDSNNRLTYQEDYLGNVEEIIFNDKGQVVEKRTYNKKEPTLCNKERFCYDEKGNMVTLDGVMKDSYGNIPSTKIEYLRGLQSKVKSPSGLVMNYGYDFNTDQLLSLSSEVDGVSNVNRFKYKRNLLESIEHDGFKVSYTHDKLGRRLETKVNDETYISTEYNEGLYAPEMEVYYGSDIKNTYNNGHVTRSVYDIDGKLKRVYSDSNYKTISYDDRDNVTNIVSNDSYINKSFTYDEYDNVLTETDSDYTKSYEYDDRRRVSSEVNTYNSKTFNYDYTYNCEVKELIDKVVLNVDDVDIVKDLEYDCLNRVSEQTLSIDDEEFIKEEFEYLTVEDNALSLIKEHNILFKGTLKESNTYEYDLNGNIIKVVTDDDETRYHYDSLSRLIREDNPSLVKTYVYKYDKRGNILLRKEYNYTLEKDLFNPIKVDKFTYSKDGWKDQLVKYNDEEFVYDSMGRPTTYRGTNMSWALDGTLSSVSGKWSITRNMDGQIIRMRENVHPYAYKSITNDSNKILVDSSFTFIYVLEKLVGFIYNGSRYYYQRNIQGDITHIYDEDKELVAKYVYDAYGRHKVLDASLQEDTNTSSIGNMNPFRYRGYYFDTKLGLYFLKSRYYDPETCRFISPDIISILDETSSSINGLNLYMYCGDNPVMYVDPSGYSWDSFWNEMCDFFSNPVVQIITTGVVIVGLGVLTAVTGPVAGTIFGAAFYGAITGAASGAIFGAACGVITGLLTDDWSGIFGSITSGMLIGSLTGAATGALTAGLNIAIGSITNGAHGVQIVGTPQKTGTLFHRFASKVEGGKMAMQIGRYSQIRYNRSLSTSGMTGRKIPDAIGVARRGKNMLIEVVSKSQTRKQMEIKCQIMIANNYASYNVISWVGSFSRLFGL